MDDLAAALAASLARGEPLILGDGTLDGAAPVSGTELVAALTCADATIFKGLTLVGARFAEVIDLDDAAVSAPLHFRNCDFEAGIRCCRGELRHLRFEGCRIGSISGRGESFLAPGLRLSFSLDVRDTSTTGAWMMQSSAIGGRISFREVELGGSGDVLDLDQSVVGQGLEYIGGSVRGAISLMGCTIAGPTQVYGGATIGTNDLRISVALARSVVGPVHFNGQGTILAGGLRLSGSAIAGDLILSNGVEIGTDFDGHSITADHLTVSDHLYTRGGVKTGGAVRLVGSRIAGQVSLGDGTIIGADLNGISIRGDRSVLGGLFLVGSDSELTGAISLIGAKIEGQTNIRDGPSVGSRDDHLSVIGDGLSTMGDIYLQGSGTTFDGGVQFMGATIGGQLNFVDGVSVGQDLESVSLNLMGAQIASDLFITDSDTSLSGSVYLNDASIGARMQVGSGASIGADIDGDSFVGDRATITSHLLVFGEETSLTGAIRLTDAVIRGQFKIEDGPRVGQNASTNSVQSDGLETASHVHILGPRTRLDGAVRLVGSTLGGQLVVSNAATIGADDAGYSLVLDGARTRDIRIAARATLQGSTHLLGAIVSGQMNVMEGANLGSDSAGESLSLDGATMESDINVIGTDVELSGSISLANATVLGELNLADQATIGIDALGSSLIAPRSSLADLSIDARLDGHVDLRYSAVTGLIRIAGTSRFNDRVPQKIALDLEAAVVQDVTLDAFAGPGGVDLRRAQVASLSDQVATWNVPGRRWLLGASQIAKLPGCSEFSGSDRRDWLARTGFDGDQPADRASYRMIADALRTGGDENEATETLIAMRKSHHPVLRYILAPIGQGYRPMRALWSLLLVVVIAWGSVWLGSTQGWFVAGQDLGQRDPSRHEEILESDECDGGDYPCLRALPYGADLVLPVVTSGDTGYWRPAAVSAFGWPIDPFAVWLVLLRLAGWALGGLFVIGVLNTVLEHQRT